MLLGAENLIGPEMVRWWILEGCEKDDCWVCGNEAGRGGWEETEIWEWVQFLLSFGVISGIVECTILWLECLVDVWSNTMVPSSRLSSLDVPSPCVYVCSRFAFVVALFERKRNGVRLKTSSATPNDALQKFATSFSTLQSQHTLSDP